MARVMGRRAQFNYTPLAHLVFSRPAVVVIETYVRAQNRWRPARSARGDGVTRAHAPNYPERAYYTRRWWSRRGYKRAETRRRTSIRHRRTWPATEIAEVAATNTRRRRQTRLRGKHTLSTFVETVKLYSEYFRIILGSFESRVRSLAVLGTLEERFIFDVRKPFAYFANRNHRILRTLEQQTANLIT